MLSFTSITLDLTFKYVIKPLTWCIAISVAHLLSRDYYIALLVGKTMINGMPTECHKYNDNNTGDDRNWSKHQRGNEVDE